MYPRIDAYRQPEQPRVSTPALAHNFSGLTPEQAAAGRMGQTFQALQNTGPNAAMLTPGATGHLGDAQLMAQLQVAQQRGAAPAPEQPELKYGPPGKSIGSNQDQRDGLDPNYTPGYGYGSRMNATGPSRTPDAGWDQQFETPSDWREAFPGQPSPATRVPTPKQMTKQPGYGFDEAPASLGRVNAYA